MKRAVSTRMSWAHLLLPEEKFGHIASQCPNKRSMTLLDIGDIESVSSSDDEMPPLEDCNDVDVDIVEPVNGDVLVIRHALNMHPNVGGDEEQREHIFHTRCLIKDKVCNLIIDRRSCINVVSTLLVEKLGLPTLKHPNPHIDFSG